LWLFNLFASLKYKIIICLKQNILILIAALFFATATFAQTKKSAPKYPSLFWEITGNGLKKPSYLFGTMHVSSKLAFHLSDSFYYAIKSVDAVALELNPDIWQGQMVRLAKMQAAYTSFFGKSNGDYLNEESFRIKKFDDDLKLGMSTEPMVVNSLLYRSYGGRQDFEEDTFLDLYIFQTGKKLGKRATGVEDYYETEKIVTEAYVDMAKEKKKKSIDTDGESYYEIQNKIQEAYRRGDLDLMDSLDRMVEKSDAFREKFLYKRNEIQANSIDTILKTSSLFVGVGAAHLAGDKGVIEMLRKKGYKLRPIKMVDRDATQKDIVDKAKVPVVFTKQVADDGFFEVNMPGPLFDLAGEYGKINRRQYSDMSNGSYYLVTRVKTYSSFLGFTESDMLKKIDSVLYENIPGKIITKKSIVRNGYKGFDITNKTRRGDLQRYNIFVTPFEVLFFKMGGKENYIDGVEGEQFFSSIKLKELLQTEVNYLPKQQGFSIKLPHQPLQTLNTAVADGINRWEYEAEDKTTGDTYMLFKKSIQQFDFLDVDTFDLSLIETSVRNDDFFEKQISRKLGKVDGYNYLDVVEKMKNGNYVSARYIIKGANYYALIAKSASAKKDFASYFNSFKFLDDAVSNASLYVDTFMHFSVTTPVKPKIDEDLRAMIYNSAKEIEKAGGYGGYAVSTSYWPKAQYAHFVNDSTGERVSVTVQEFPKYFSPKDSANYWKNEVEEYYKGKMVLVSKDSSLQNSNNQWYSFSVQDTGSSRKIYRKIILKDNYSYTLVSLTDTLSKPSSFINTFYKTFTPAAKKLGSSIYENKLDLFFTDLFSKDSATNAQAFQSLSSIYYGEKGVEKLVDAVNKLSITNRNYFETKTKLINELGYIKDTLKPSVVNHLKIIYDKTADTSIFQNEVVTALVNHKTLGSFTLLKEILLQDPPIFEDNYGYSTLLSNIEDSLKLARTLFPELLQLTSLDDYKQPILSLLVTLVDSNLMKSTDYESYFAKIYFDAKIEMKKQQAKDERRVEEEMKKKEKGDDEDDRYNDNTYDNYSGVLYDYSALLLPQYDKNVNVQKFFEKLLKSKDPTVRLKTATTLLRGGKPVADSILLNIAADDKYRLQLFNVLFKNKLSNKFPTKYATQQAITKSFLIGEKSYDKPDSLSFVKKELINYQDKKGWVFYYRYRLKKEDDWKIAICGLQPVNEKEISDCDELSFFGDKKIKKDEPEVEQFAKQLKRLIIASHDSGKYFYSNNNYGAYPPMEGGY
jgi:uncharacterized protein YbaP (TraB family)